MKITQKIKSFIGGLAKGCVIGVFVFLILSGMINMAAGLWNHNNWQCIAGFYQTLLGAALLYNID